MLNLLGEASSSLGSIIPLIILAVLLVGMFVFNAMSRKKNQEKAAKMMEELKKGDKVIIYPGIYAEVVSMRETNMGKVLVVSTGDKSSKKVSYMEVNAGAIVGMDTKEDLVLDENGDVIEPTNPEEPKI
ncbi:MAG: preprotein translocase subunit YajC [Clostridia bacterium]|nr:preprotein translocase subunit YajC [Clostridia bacterium]